MFRYVCGGTSLSFKYMNEVVSVLVHAIYASDVAGSNLQADYAHVIPLVAVETFPVGHDMQWVPPPEG